MRRALSLTGLAAALLVLAVLGAGAGSSGGGSYRVRAIFENAFSVIPGEDVKVAGVKVGTIDSLDVTPDAKAAVVLSISKPGFDDFRTDATCTIRPQSLIGEKFVECVPTQPRVAGVPEAPPLSRVPDGQHGAGQYLLPSSQTSLPVDLDLINNILRLPYRQRLSILLNELGTGLAGRGDDLRAIIRRANPALAATDRVLGILAQQNRVLDRLAVDSDTSLAPITRERARVADFIVGAGATAQATAERSQQLEAGLKRFPPFLTQLRPTLDRLGGLADQATPVLTDLGRQAPAISRFVEALGPFSSAASPALKSLGSAADVGRVALPPTLPIIRDVHSLATVLRPLAANLAALTASLHDSGGIERLLDYGFYQDTAINGFDSFGHYLRAALIVNLCSTYVTTANPSCSANFKGGTGANTGSPTVPGVARSAAVQTTGRSPYLIAEDRILHGEDPAKVLASLRRATGHGQRRGRHGSSGAAPGAGTGSLPYTGGPSSGAAPPAPTPSAPLTTAPSPAPPSSVTSLLNYLLGNG